MSLRRITLFKILNYLRLKPVKSIVSSFANSSLPNLKMFEFVNPFSQQLTVEFLLTLGKLEIAYSFQIPSVDSHTGHFAFVPSNHLHAGEGRSDSHLLCLCDQVRLAFRTCSDLITITILSKSAVRL